MILPLLKSHSRPKELRENSSVRRASLPPLTCTVPADAKPVFRCRRFAPHLASHRSPRGAVPQGQSRCCRKNASSPTRRRRVPHRALAHPLLRPTISGARHDDSWTARSTGRPASWPGTRCDPLQGEPPGPDRPRSFGSASERGGEGGVEHLHGQGTFCRLRG